jgi:hypothetical protein
VEGPNKNRSREGGVGVSFIVCLYYFGVGIGDEELVDNGQQKKFTMLRQKLGFWIERRI